VVDAVLAAGFDDPIDARSRVAALAALKGQPDFEPLAVAFKRVVNIIKGGINDSVDPALFEAQCEGDLLAAQQLAAQQVADQVANGDYAAALQTIAGLRPAVDAFFDGVMVMADDAAVKTNRLALLSRVAELFTGIADFARIA